MHTHRFKTSDFAVHNSALGHLGVGSEIVHDNRWPSHLRRLNAPCRVAFIWECQKLMIESHSRAGGFHESGEQLRLAFLY